MSAQENATALPPHPITQSSFLWSARANRRVSLPRLHCHKESYGDMTSYLANIPGLGRVSPLIDISIDMWPWYVGLGRGMLSIVRRFVIVQIVLVDSV